MDQFELLDENSTSPRAKNEAKPRRTIFKAKHLVLLILAVTTLVLIGVLIGFNPVIHSSSTPHYLGASGCVRWPHRRSAQDSRSGSHHRWLDRPGCAGGRVKPSCPAGVSPPVLLISMDGFRAEYLARKFTPNIRHLSECGVHTPYMRAVFPSKTFPNHYSIVTGLYPESHGIIDNRMYDPKLSKMFKLNDKTINDPQWWKGEPIWNTVRKAGKKSATIFWPGSEAKIQGLGPDVCYKYNGSVNFEDRVDGILRWLDEPPDTWPHFMTLYVDQPDSAGHEQGPFGDWVNSNLTRVDNMIGHLMAGLVDRGLDNCVNLILLADHGMAGIDCDHVVALSDYVNTTNYHIYDGVFGRMSGKYVKRSDGKVVDLPNGDDSAEAMLSKLRCDEQSPPSLLDWYVRLSKKEDLPKRFHYSHNRRIDDIVVTMAKGYQISRDPPDGSNFECYSGGHGYDNTYSSMHALFLAHGPSFRHNFTVKPFENIELYNLMTELLGIHPAPNNGTEGSLRHLLRNPSPATTTTGPSLRTEFTQCKLQDRSANLSDCYCGNSQESSNENIAKDLVKEATEEDFPFGLAVHENLEDICQMTHRDYVTMFSARHKMPLITAFVLHRQGRATSSAQNRPIRDERCIVADPRISSPVPCSVYDDDQIIPVPLHSTGLFNQTSDVIVLSSNVVPMYKSFKEGVWDKAMLLLDEYAEKYGGIIIMLGPIFDENSDGHYDDPIVESAETDGDIRLPTHYYILAMKCSADANVGNLVCPTGHLDTFVIILPHRDHLQNCQDYDPMTYFRNNVARIKDLELLTGLKFLADMPFEERVSLETHLEVGLWDRISWMDDTSEDGCPVLEEAWCPPGYNLDYPPLLLIAIDGFRPDFIQRNVTPTLKRLYDCGTSAPYMRSSYPTVMLPNLYTIVTGLYPASHGIIDNVMYDMKQDKYFKFGSHDPTWWRGEAIWNTLSKENKTAFTLFRLGPNTVRDFNYNRNPPYIERVKMALNWLSGPQTSLVSLYFAAVNKASHIGGMNSPRVTESLEDLETTMKELMDGLHRMKLDKCVNIVIISDHGVSDVNCNQTFLVSKLLPEDYRKVSTFGEAAGRISNKYVRRQNGSKVEHVADNERVSNKRILDALNCYSPHLSVFDKHDAPLRLHYANNPLIDDILLFPRDPWLVESPVARCYHKASHGYDPLTTPSMNALFLGYGPSFKHKTSVPPFENIELYNLLTVLTNATAAPNNGTHGSLYHLLRHPPTLPPPLPDALNYTRPVYPRTRIAYDERSTICYCHTSLNASIKVIDRRLGASLSDISELAHRHLSHGIPVSYETSASILWQRDYVMAYGRHIPLWTAFQLNSTQINQSRPIPNCLRADVRLKSVQQPNCDDLHQGAAQDITYEYLFSPEWSTDFYSAMDALLLSNIVPMDKQFIQEVWQPLRQYLASWTTLFGQLDIIAGPVFDYNTDGHRDTQLTHYVSNSSLPLPSHYFVTAFKCHLSLSSCDGRDVISFVLPNHAITNCMSLRDYLTNNMARLRDIELVTGLHFLTANYTQQSIQMRTLLPTKLWATEPEFV